MILESDQHITETITNVELTRELIEYLGWSTISDRLGFKNEWVFFNKDYPHTHLNYICQTKKFVFVHVSARLNRLVHETVNTYFEFEELLNDYGHR